MALLGMLTIDLVRIISSMTRLAWVSPTPYKPSPRAFAPLTPPSLELEAALTHQVPQATSPQRTSFTLLEVCPCFSLLIRLLILSLFSIGLGYEVAGDMDQLADTGFWISEKLGRQNASRVANAIRAKRVREAQLREKGGVSEAFKAKL